MKTLFLLRHAKASKDDPSLADIKRPLTERGFSDARLMSEVLRQKNLVPEKIIASTAVRAYTTAFVFAAALEKVSDDIELSDALYDSDTPDYFETISGISESFSSCMLAGHNDTITMVAERLLGTYVESMKTCGVMIISSAANSWTEFATSRCKLELSIYPSQFK